MNTSGWYTTMGGMHVTVALTLTFILGATSQLTVTHVPTWGSWPVTHQGMVGLKGSVYAVDDTQSALLHLVPDGQGTWVQVEAEPVWTPEHITGIPELAVDSVIVRSSLVGTEFVVYYVRPEAEGVPRPWSILTRVRHPVHDLDAITDRVYQFLYNKGIVLLRCFSNSVGQRGTAWLRHPFDPPPAGEPQHPPPPSMHFCEQTDPIPALAPVHSREGGAYWLERPQGSRSGAGELRLFHVDGVTLNVTHLSTYRLDPGVTHVREEPGDRNSRPLYYHAASGRVIYAYHHSSTQSFHLLSYHISSNAWTTQQFPALLRGSPPHTWCILGDPQANTFLLVSSFRNRTTITNHPYYAIAFAHVPTTDVFSVHRVWRRPYVPSQASPYSVSVAPSPGVAVASVGSSLILLTGGTGVHVGRPRAVTYAIRSAPGVINALSPQWRPATSPEGGALLTTGASLANLVFIPFGTFVQSGQPTDRVLRYDAIADTWVSLDRLDFRQQWPSTRLRAATIIQGDTLYVFAGFHPITNVIPVDLLWGLHTRSESWSEVLWDTPVRVDAGRYWHGIAVVNATHLALVYPQSGAVKWGLRVLDPVSQRSAELDAEFGNVEVETSQWVGVEGGLYGLIRAVDATDEVGWTLMAIDVHSGKVRRIDVSLRRELVGYEAPLVFFRGALVVVQPQFEEWNTTTLLSLQLPTCAPNTLDPTQCLPCGVGSILSQQGDCQTCPPGFYSEDPHTTHCHPCPQGTYNNLYGASSHHFCLPCPAGTYTPTPNRTVCLPCREDHCLGLIGSTSARSNRSSLHLPANITVFPPPFNRTTNLPRSVFAVTGSILLFIVLICAVCWALDRTPWLDDLDLLEWQHWFMLDDPLRRRQTRLGGCLTVTMISCGVLYLLLLLGEYAVGNVIEIQSMVPPFTLRDIRPAGNISVGVVFHRFTGECCAALSIVKTGWDGPTHVQCNSGETSCHINWNCPHCQATGTAGTVLVEIPTSSYALGVTVEVRSKVNLIVTPDETLSRVSFDVPPRSVLKGRNPVRVLMDSVATVTRQYGRLGPLQSTRTGFHTTLIEASVPRGAVTSAAAFSATARSGPAVEVEFLHGDLLYSLEYVHRHTVVSLASAILGGLTGLLGTFAVVLKAVESVLALYNNRGTPQVTVADKSVVQPSRPTTTSTDNNNNMWQPVHPVR